MKNWEEMTPKEKLDNLRDEYLELYGNYATIAKKILIAFFFLFISWAIYEANKDIKSNKKELIEVREIYFEGDTIYVDQNGEVVNLKKYK